MMVYDAPDKNEWMDVLNKATAGVSVLVILCSVCSHLLYVLCEQSINSSSTSTRIVNVYSSSSYVPGTRAILHGYTRTLTGYIHRLRTGLEQTV